MRLGADLSIEYANSVACEITGWRLDQMLGKPVARVVYLLQDENDYPLEKHLQKALDERAIHSVQDVALQLKARRGDDVFIEYSFAPVAPDNESGFVGGVFAFADVTDRRNQFSTLLWNSTHDALTGLVNRDEIERRLDAAILTAKRNNWMSTLLYLDLDQFKVVNDTCGHAAGDKLLKQLSGLMADMLRSRDTLARLGGDEFAVLLDKCPVVEAEAIARKLQTAISKHRFIWDEKLFHVGVSVGIVEISSTYDEVSELLIHADTACYHAKESGRNTIQIHRSGDMDLDEKRSQLNIVADINEALEENKFRLYFQKLSSVDNDQESRWEVLVRMFNRPGDFLLPGAFLPSAERFGLIKQIDLWVLEHCLSEVSAMCRETESVFPLLNINVSGATVSNDDYLLKLTGLLKKFDIDPSRLCFELTETVAVSNVLRAKKFIDHLRNIGCSFALDDFGIGMSSLSYLRELPLDYIKIDGGFVQNIVGDEVNAAIVDSVKTVSDLLKISTVAEGVETEDQAKHLSELGIDYLQGFYLHRPVPYEEFSALVVDKK
jgi:two-component system CheB/CheR fusion protein